MTFVPEKHLHIKVSTIPGAGKGLFTSIFIPKGTRIIEYTGKITTWKEVNSGDHFNGYVYYINRNHVIDGKDDMKSLARYANDARGITTISGVTNNSKYVEEDKRVYIVARKDIEAGAEIFVSYGKEYWDVIRFNAKLEKGK